jgi:hypothetical protein
VLDVQKRVQESRCDGGRRQGVENWARREAPRLASRPEVDLTIDRWRRDCDRPMRLGCPRHCKTSTDVGSRTLARRVREAVVDPLLDRLTALRRPLEQSTETVDAIRSG